MDKERAPPRQLLVGVVGVLFRRFLTIKLLSDKKWLHVHVTFSLQNKEEVKYKVK